MRTNPFKGFRDYKLIKGFQGWKSRLTTIRKTNEIRGLEWLFALSVHFLHVFTLSGWIKFRFDPLQHPPPEEELAFRNKVIEAWVIFELLVLLWVTFYLPPIGSFRIAVAIYLLYEILLNLCSIIFVGKLQGVGSASPTVYPPTSSIERSLLLFGFNIIQIILIFAIFYRSIFNFTPKRAIFESALVLGTIGHPELDPASHWWWVVTLQILTDLVLLVVFLAAFVGNLGAFKRRN
jgi:uncharacterized protein with PQ loop repeat